MSVNENMKSRLDWNALLAEQRLRELLGGSKSTKVARESRTEYERDRDRTVYSSPIRRLIRKTQVFPLDPSDFIRTRLMHSVEVSTSTSEGLTSQSVRDVIKKKEELSTEQLDAIAKIAENFAASSTISAILHLGTLANSQSPLGSSLLSPAGKSSRIWAVPTARRPKIF